MSDVLVVNIPTTLLLESDTQETTVVVEQSVIILQTDGGTGPAGAQGPAGAPGGSVFIYTQASPSASWIVTHNLNRFVSVTLLNAGGVVVEADIVETSPTVTTIAFSQPATGTALIT